ncbi:uncharacterized protein LOC106167980 [Lingula anatina]|uniref:Uncharacterized protein LOC106167980 n=1 Tax=Lingula anatina TaxID=7574 RepID=A0A1S3IXS4_LINAN|nr:uncharacterized protein LOC106167980 [Lingula anatina]|eukprot:XP_013402349.1 uncharacterized protein LOC106167980 [Lingula anatina]
MAETPNIRVTRSSSKALGGSGSGARVSSRLQTTQSEPRSGPTSRPSRTARSTSTSKKQSKTRANSTPMSQSGAESGSTPKSHTDIEPGSQSETVTKTTKSSLKRAHSPVTEKLQVEIAVEDTESEVEEPEKKRRTTTGHLTKRRSSFVRGRINKPLSALTSAELSVGIPSELPGEERLSRLTKECLEFTLQKLSEEFSDLDGVQQFGVQARDAVAGVISKLETSGKFSRACNKGKSCLPNPVNSEIEQAASEYQGHIDRLQEEDATWAQLMKEREDAAAQLEQ